MNNLPPDGFVRVRQIVGDPKANPPIPPIIPVSRSLWWEWVKSGKAPQPHRLGTRVTAWRISEIRHLIEEMSGGEVA